MQRLSRRLLRLSRSMSSATEASTARKEELVSAYKSIKSRIPDSVTLVAVSKLKPASDIATLHAETKHLHYGENYAQELIDKAKALPKDIKWHFIGGLQSNKCKGLASGVPNLFAVETVDSIKKANELEKGRKMLAETEHSLEKVNIYVQVNTSGESEKSGVEPGDAVLELVRHITTLEHLQFAGLMTIGSLANSTQHEGENADFAKLKACKQQVLDAKISGVEQIRLSMGMSEDFEDAIKQGSDQVRVGSKLFGARPPKENAKVENKVAEGQS
ncbi:alanine racemase family protein [Protomyces lactucae-debilis]|uniref:Pyridoxal phosphate homeostasis protein n=1 Tax=Protomyces lactucae-debilis TaxID=2754530 RepID=A0A1Y2ESK5_PROLT|nr:alanine racemase family protein [Protomyces lactucae-debilis]ORY74136.1 alanine racemase family protein [Protomyces lactucae-debilis]